MEESKKNHTYATTLLKKTDGSRGGFFFAFAIDTPISLD